jgi:hypothetical protein
MTVSQFIRATGATCREGWRQSAVMMVDGVQIVWRSGVYGGAIVTYPDKTETYHSNPGALREVAEQLRTSGAIARQ